MWRASVHQHAEDTDNDHYGEHKERATYSAIHRPVSLHNSMLPFAQTRPG